MMKYKKIVIFICMFIVLAMIVVAPMIFHEMNDEKILNHLYIEDLVYETRKIEKSYLSLEEKLKLLVSYENDNQIVSSSHKEVLNDENKAMLDQYLIKELKTLETLKIIPDIHIQNSLEYRSLTTQLYSDVSHLGNHVSLWNVFFMNDDYYIEVWMDSETKKIYQMTIDGFIPSLGNEKTLDIFCTQYLNMNQKYSEKFFTLGYKSNNFMAIFLNASI